MRSTIIVASLACLLPSGASAFAVSRPLSTTVRVNNLESTTRRATTLYSKSILEDGATLTKKMTSAVPDDPNMLPDLQQKSGPPAALILWMGALSSLLLYNNFVGPFPAGLIERFANVWPLAHALGGMMFGGGIIITTLVEWLVVGSGKPDVIKFWFRNVPALDAKVVIPALSTSIISGTALSVDHYESLSQAPMHVTGTLYTLLAFAAWWAVTDVTTQGEAKKALAEWEDETEDPPRVLELRRYSNVVSCLFVCAIYSIMVLKPGS